MPDSPSRIETITIHASGFHFPSHVMAAIGFFFIVYPHVQLPTQSMLLLLICWFMMSVCFQSGFPAKFLKHM
jgi:hypothetical protein